MHVPRSTYCINVHFAVLGTTQKITAFESKVYLFTNMKHTLYIIIINIITTIMNTAKIENTELFLLLQYKTRD